MSDIKDNFLVPFLGALQASLAVLLTIFAGVLAAQFDLLGEKSAKDISKVCVRLFLPALLIVNVGQQLNIESVRTCLLSRQICELMSLIGNPLSSRSHLGHHLQCLEHLLRSCRVSF
jgi:predicted permease